MFPSKRQPSAALSALGLTVSASALRWGLAAGLAAGWVAGLTVLSPTSALARPVTAPPQTPPSVLPFLENDYPTARAKAARSGKLLFVDAWAMWCHTCLSMRNFVFTDPQLQPLADRMVYLALDTEEPSSAAFVQRFPISSWPTFLVMNAEEKVVARWTGAMSAAELSSRLKTVLSMQAQQQPRLALADAEAAAGHPLEAARLYEDAMSEPGSRPQALLGLLQALRELGHHERCVEVYEQSFREVGKSALATDFAAYTGSCLDKLSDVDRRQKLRRRLRSDLEYLLADAAAELSMDDRSDAYGTMIELSDALGEPAEGDRLAKARLELLEKAAAAAISPTVAATFDAHRFDSYRRLKRWQPAESMLLSSAKALPTDYNPPARLARLYYETGRIEEAQRYVDLALSRCQGPRRVSMYELRASIANSQGHTRAAIESLTSAISIYQASQSAATRGTETPRLRALRQQVTALEAKLREQPEPPEPADSQAGPPPAKSSSAKKKAPAKPAKPAREPAPRYEPGSPVASLGATPPPQQPSKKRDRRVAHRDSTIK
jgi:tetratricopeptide (TPR) repeat protein